jgi:hypothetical protein
VSDPVSLARSARESLSKGLNALQSDPKVPPNLIELGAPIAQAMGGLHQIEKNGGSQISPFADNALAAMRTALAQMQTLANPPAALITSMEAVAASLGMVHTLSKLQPKAAGGAPASQAKAPPSTQQSPHFPQASTKPPSPAAKQATVPMGQAAPQFAPQQSAAPQAPPQPAAAPQFVPQQAPPPFVQPPQAAAPAQPSAAPQFVPAQSAPQFVPQHQAPVFVPPAQAQAAPPGPAADPFGRTAQAQPAPAPANGAPRSGQSIPSPANTGGQVVDAALGAHSPTNFYKGLSGNDIIEHGGLFVATYMIPKIGMPVRLRIALPGGYEFEANAVVKWSRESGDPFGDSQPGFGAQFTGISPEARQLVYRYVRNREPLFHDDM